MVPCVCMWFSSTHQMSDWQTACQVAPFRKLRKEKSEQGKGKVTDFIKYDIRQMHTAFTGTIPFSREEEDVLVSLASTVTYIVLSIYQRCHLQVHRLAFWERLCQNHECCVIIVPGSVF